MNIAPSFLPSISVTAAQCVTGSATVYTEIIGDSDPGFTLTGVKIVNDGVAFGGTGANYTNVLIKRTPSGGSLATLATVSIPTALAANTDKWQDIVPLASILPQFKAGDTLTVVLGKAGTPVKSSGNISILLAYE